MKASGKSKNPLFVVTDKGRVVEEAQNLFDAWVKRLGLGGLVEKLNELLALLLTQIQSYAMLVAVQEFLDQLIKKLESLSKMAFPEFYFYKK